MLNHEEIIKKWTEIKAGVKNIWGDVDENDLEETKGNMQSVAVIIKKKYDEPNDSINKKLDQLMDSFDNETDKSFKVKDGVSSYHRSPIDEYDSSEIFESKKTYH